MLGRSKRFATVLALVFIGVLVGAPDGRAAPLEPATNDPGLAAQWGLAAIGAPQAWAIARGAGITVAVIDSGVDQQHEDLQGRIAGTASCLDTGGDATKCTDGTGNDDDGHGTHVAGIIAAAADNGRGIAGVAPDAKVLAIKVLRQQGNGQPPSGSASDVSAGIDYAIRHGAKVINLSLGSITQSLLGPAFSAAINDAWNAGVVPVIAAGNDFILGSGFSNEPALVVDALNRAGTKASYSNGVGAAKWALAAPGGESDDSASCTNSPNGVLSTYWRPDNDVDAYACVAGTSMAAPHVAGAVAILLSAGLTPQAAIDRLLAAAHDLGQPGRDGVYGSGALDVAAAVAGLTPTTTMPGATTAPTTDSAPETTTAPPTPSTDVTTAPPVTSSEPTSTTPAPVVTLPSAPTVQAHDTSARTSRDDGVPLGLASVAVGMALGVGTLSGWQLVRNAGWAKRTP